MADVDVRYFHTGLWISASFCLLVVLTSVCLSLWLIHENKKLAAEVSWPIGKGVSSRSLILRQGVPDVVEMEDTSTGDVNGRQVKQRYVW